MLKILNLQIAFLYVYIPVILIKVGILYLASIIMLLLVCSTSINLHRYKCALSVYVKLCIYVEVSIFVEEFDYFRI